MNPLYGNESHMVIRRDRRIPASLPRTGLSSESDKLKTCDETKSSFASNSPLDSSVYDSSARRRRRIQHSTSLTDIVTSNSYKSTDAGRHQRSLSTVNEPSSTDETKSGKSALTALRMTTILYQQFHKNSRINTVTFILEKLV